MNKYDYIYECIKILERKNTEAEAVAPNDNLNIIPIENSAVNPFIYEGDNEIKEEFEEEKVDSEAYEDNQIESGMFEIINGESDSEKVLEYIDMVLDNGNYTQWDDWVYDQLINFLINYRSGNLAERKKLVNFLISLYEDAYPESKTKEYSKFHAAIFLGDDWDPTDGENELKNYECCLDLLGILFVVVKKYSNTIEMAVKYLKEKLPLIEKKLSQSLWEFTVYNIVRYDMLLYLNSISANNIIEPKAELKKEGIELLKACDELLNARWSLYHFNDLYKYFNEIAGVIL